MVWNIVAPLIGGGLSLLSGRSAGKSAERAARTSADAQIQGLEYLKESERVPMHYRDQALAALAAEYGLSQPPPKEPQGMPAPSASTGLLGTLRNKIYDTMRQPDDGYSAPEAPVYAGPSVTEMAKRSPIYKAMLSSRGAGEEALLRGRSAAGGLRGGSTLSDLVDYNTQLENQALLTSYENIMGGLSSMAGAQGYAPQIAQQYSSIGQTKGAGQLAKAQAYQQGLGGLVQGLGMAGGAYFGGGSV